MLALQINSGLNAVLGLPVGEVSQLGIIAVTTVLFLESAVSRVTKGIARAPRLERHREPIASSSATVLVSIQNGWHLRSIVVRLKRDHSCPALSI